MYKIIGADGKEYGPISVEVLRQWIAEGRANEQTRVLPEGSTEWKAIGQIPELASLLAGTPATPTIAAAPAPISIAATPRNNSYAVAGLTLGILSITIGVCCCYGFPFSVPGIVCSAIALNQIKQDPVTHQGKGMATAGLILSIIGIILGVVLVILAVSFGSTDWLKKLHRM